MTPIEWVRRWMAARTVERRRAVMRGLLLAELRYRARDIEGERIAGRLRRWARGRARLCGKMTESAREILACLMAGVDDDGGW